MTRLESGSLQLNRDWHSVEELVGSALARLEPGLDGPRGPGRRSRRTCPLVPVDGVLVEQALVNLLENAVKYTEPAMPDRRRGGGGRTARSRSRSRTRAPACPRGRRSRCSRSSTAPRSAQRGFGLGLPICRAIVTAHGGPIWAERREPRGTRFRFTLPLGDGAAGPAKEDDG